METLRDEHLSRLLRAEPMPDTRNLNAEIMHAVRRRVARRRALRTVLTVCGITLAAAFVLAMLIGVFALLGTISDFGDWLRAADEYAVSGLLHLRMFCRSDAVQLIGLAVVVFAAVRIVIAIDQRRRSKA